MTDTIIALETICPTRVLKQAQDLINNSLISNNLETELMCLEELEQIIKWFETKSINTIK